MEGWEIFAGGHAYGRELQGYEQIIFWSPSRNKYVANNMDLSNNGTEWEYFTLIEDAKKWCDDKLPR